MFCHPKNPLHQRFVIGWVAITLLILTPLISPAQEKSDQSLEEKKPFVEHIEMLDRELLKLIDVNAKIETLTTGYRWTEGPVWLKDKKHLLFTDIPNNKIHRWSENGGVSVFIANSGYEDEAAPNKSGANGLSTDANGNLIVCDQGNRRLYRLEADGSRTTLVDRFEGKRFNSPNDLVLHSNGDIYFTDPPYGLIDKTKRELDWLGVYHLSASGKISLLTKQLERPNGIGLSPDEKTLYVAQSLKTAALIKSYNIQPDGMIELPGKTLLDATKFVENGDPGLPDGMAIDVQGNLWVTGPGGVLIVTPQGKLLGRILMGRATANCTFGDDGSTLYMTSSDRVCRVTTKTKGLGF